MQHIRLFDNYKYCSICQRPLPSSYEDDTCSICKEQAIFTEVKDYIRTNDVTEYDVAQHFNLPLRQVQKWIREGRIEYKETTLTVITMHCVNCGAQIAFGHLCAKCLKQQNVSGHSSLDTKEAGRMRFFDE